MARDISTKTTAKNLAELLNQYYAKKADLPTKLSDLTNDGGFISETTIDEKISAAVAGALIPSGSIAFSALPALAKANCNHIYNITDAFETTSDFVEGEGKSYPAGTNVAIINTGTTSSPVYKYDCYTGTFDFSGFMQKQTGATTGHFAKFDENGQAVDAGVGESDFIKQHQDITGKADRVDDATNGHLAGLNGDGNLTDSGIAAADVQVKTVPAAAGNIATLGADGKLADGGKTVAQLTNVIEGVQVDGTDLTPDGNKKVNITGKADRAANPTAGHVATLDANGNPVDSGIVGTDVLVAGDISDYTVAELKTLLGITDGE